MNLREANEQREARRLRRSTVSSRPRGCPLARGFTLLELLIAIALIAALLAALFAFFWNTFNTRHAIDQEIARQRAASLLIHSVEGDLMTALVGDQRSGAGIDGSESSLSILRRRVPVQHAERGAADPVILADLQRSTYRFDPSAQVISVRHELVGFDAEEAGEGELGGTVHRVRFRYHDGSGWRGSFDSLAADALPRAVEIAIWFDPRPGEPRIPDEEEPQPTERSTFDPDVGFDESTYAQVSDLAVFGEPPPDRVRVIHVPDSGGSGKRE